MKMKSLMLVIFYISVASPLSLRDSGYENAHDEVKELESYFVLGLAATCVIGLIIALVVHITPNLLFKKSSAATHKVPKLIQQLMFETKSLLQSVAEYTRNIGVASKSAKQTRTVIEYYINARNNTLKQLENLLPALEAECKLPCSSKIDYNRINKFIKCSRKQQKHANLIKLPTTQLLLGEEQTSQNFHVRQVKTKINQNLSGSFDNLVSQYCNCEYDFLFSNNATRHHRNLDLSMEGYLNAMRLAIADAGAFIMNNDEASRKSAGPLIRSRVAFVAVYSFVHELQDMINSYSDITSNQYDQDMPKSTLHSRFLSTMTMPWNSDVNKRRLAIKTSFGMGLATLWVSIPYLRGYVAYPNAIWPAITVASVSLETSGSSYTKCMDRLWGTLIAAGVSLIIDKVVMDGLLQLILVSLFTFLCMFMKDPEHEYAFRYSCSSLGSILYGSFYNNVEVGDYAPNRVMLVLTGAFIFLFVEVLVFPRSSRTVVQAQSLQFLEDMEAFLFECSKVCRKIPSISTSTTADSNELLSIQVENPLFMLREGYKQIELEENLDQAALVVKNTTDLIKKELKSGINEPVLGLNIKLDAYGYEALLSEYSHCVAQANLLTTTLHSLLGFYSCMSEDHVARELNWPDVLDSSIVNIALKLEKCADQLRQVFPHGLLRPGASTLSKTIRSLSIFREFEETRLEILNDVADKFVEYMKPKDEVQYTPGFLLTVTLAISALLSISRSLQKSGLHLEAIIQSFPAEQNDTEEFTIQTLALTHVEMHEDIEEEKKE